MSIETAAIPLPTSNSVNVDLSPSGGRAPECDNGLHDVFVKAITERESKFKAGQMNTVLEFALASKPEEGTLWVQPSRTEKGKLPWTATLRALKVPFTPGKKNTFTNDDLIGKTCKALIENDPPREPGGRPMPRIKALVAA